jgi:hypothetical protein
VRRGVCLRWTRSCRLARVKGSPLLATLFHPSTNVGHRVLGFKAYIAIYALGWGVSALACGLPVVLGYV